MDAMQYIGLLTFIAAGVGFLYREVKELKGEIKEVQTDLKSNISQVQTNLKGEISQIQTELKADIKEIQSINQGILTKIAVMESRLSDINQNVSHLMWHHQTPPAKEVGEE